MCQAPEKLLKRGVPVSMACFTIEMCKQCFIPSDVLSDWEPGAVWKDCWVLLLTFVVLAKDLQRNASLQHHSANAVK